MIEAASIPGLRGAFLVTRDLSGGGESGGGESARRGECHAAAGDDVGQGAEAKWYARAGSAASTTAITDANEPTGADLISKRH